MRKKFFPLWGSILLLAIIAFTIYSCQKNKSATQAQQDALAVAKQSVKDSISKSGWRITVPVNETVHAFYAYPDGSEVPKSVLVRHSKTVSDAITSACDYSNSPTATLNSYSVIYNCLYGLEVTWNYTVSTNNNLVASNGTVTTKGHVYLYQGATLVYSNTSVASSGITDLGSDPSNSGYELFSVTFTTPYLSSTYFNSAYTVQVGATLVTNCPDVEAFPIALQSYSGVSLYQYPATTPCSRIDPWYFNSSSAPIRVWGEDAVGTCTGTGFTYPDLQEINFSIDGGGWIGGSTTSSYFSYYLSNAYTFPPYPNFATLQMGYVDPYGIMILQLSGLSSGTHTIAIRARNITYNSGAEVNGAYPVPSPGTNCCAGPWSAVSTYSVTY